MIYVMPELGEGTLQHFSTKLSVTDSSKELKEQAIYYGLYCWAYIMLHLVFCTERNISETGSLSQLRLVGGISWIG
jgi:hypothetical protein